MDFLKSAVASAISKEPAFGFKLGEAQPLGQSLWKLYNGTKRDDGSPCSIFVFDVTRDRSQAPLAKNAVRKVRTLRHPGILKILDTLETETTVYLATESVTPLALYARHKNLDSETSKWGLSSIAAAVAFINNEGRSIHGLIRMSSVFVCSSGEWKLGSFDLLSSMQDSTTAIIYHYGSLAVDARNYAPPEVTKSGWEVVKQHPITAVDSFGFGILIYEAFAGEYSATEQLLSSKAIPSVMQQSYKRLLHHNPRQRLSVSDFIEIGRRKGGFFDTTFINLAAGIDNLGLKESEERESLLLEIDELSDKLPPEFLKAKVLPELIKSIEFGGGGVEAFALMMKIGKQMATEEWELRLNPSIIRFFANPDRALRLSLLEHLDEITPHLSQKVVSSQIFPQISTGFTDPVPIVREQTVKAVLGIIEKLTERIINGEMLRFLAKTANDEQPGIRTNTTICMGKIARYLGPTSRQKVLIAAFSRSLRDPFVHARSAALLALAATVDIYSGEDAATKILPAICPSLVDKEQIVREQATKAHDIYWRKIQDHILTIPNVIAKPAKDGSLAQDEKGPELLKENAGWTGWAMSSLLTKPQPGSQITTKSPHILASTHSTQVPLPAKKSSIPSAPSAMVDTIIPSTFSIVDPQHESDVDDYWGSIDDQEDLSDVLSRPIVDSHAISNSLPHQMDEEEPDFEAWLSSQAKTKTSARRPLPKGLAGSSKAQPANLERPRKPTSTNSRADPPQKIVSDHKSVSISAPINEDLGDDWGDAWA